MCFSSGLCKLICLFKFSLHKIGNFSDTLNISPKNVGHVELKFPFRNELINLYNFFKLKTELTTLLTDSSELILNE